MKLREWLSREGLSIEDFAARIGRDRATVYRLLSEEREPAASTVYRVWKATNGEVGLEDFMGNMSAAG